MFQSTPSGGKATDRFPPPINTLQCFNPRLPGGRRPIRHIRQPETRRFNPRLPGGRRLDPHNPISYRRDVSIHAFRGEGDLCRLFSPQSSNPFQSTPSGGKATCANGSSWSSRRRFNPRLPGGRRLRVNCKFAPRNTFQSTPSGGKATCIAALF